MKQHLNLQIEKDKLPKQAKAIHTTWSGMYIYILVPMLPIIFILIEFVIRDSTPMSEILHDIFSVSPLLILVVAMYLLTIKITKDI